MTQTTMPRMLNAREVAQILGVCAKTVRRLADAGGLPKGRRVGARLRWHSEEIARFMNSKAE